MKPLKTQEKISAKTILDFKKIKIRIIFIFLLQSFYFSLFAHKNERLYAYGGFGTSINGSSGIIGAHIGIVKDKRWDLITGIGFTKYNGGIFHAEFNTRIKTEKKLNPMISCGYAITSGTVLILNENSTYIENYQTKSIQYLFPGLGVHWKMNDRFSFDLTFGYRFHLSDINIKVNSVNQTNYYKIWQSFEDNIFIKFRWNIDRW